MILLDYSMRTVIDKHVTVSFDVAIFNKRMAAVSEVMPPGPITSVVSTSHLMSTQQIFK